MSFEKAFKKYSLKAREYSRQFPEVLTGLKITNLEYGLDADGDPQIYYFVLDNGTKIGLARVYENGAVKELDRTERYKDGSIIRFEFHNWELGNMEDKIKKLTDIKLEDLSRMEEGFITTSKPPKPSPPRLIREFHFGRIGYCKKCGSSLKTKWFFKFIGCIQPKCENYYKRIK